MVAQVKDPKEEITKKLDLSSLPEKSNVHIHMGNTDVVQGVPKGDLSKQSLGAIVAGTGGAVVGYMGTKLGLNQHMAEFENQVDIATSKAITGRSGFGVALSETGGFGGAAGLAHGEVYRANYGKMARSGEYGKLPKFLYDTFRTEGVMVASLAGAAALGTVGAVMAYKAIAPEKKVPAPDWSDRVATDKDKPREI